MAKHTSAPWGFRDHSPKCVIVGGPFHEYTNGSAQSQVALATGLQHGDAAEQEANAHLIAAAPDLLAELVHLLRLLEPLEQEGRLNIPGLATLNGPRAAIAKAKPQ